MVLDTLRGEGERPVLEAGDPTAPYMIVEVAVPADAHDISLEFGNAASQPLIPDPDGFVRFLVPRTRIGTKVEVRFTSANQSHVISVPMQSSISM